MPAISAPAKVLVTGASGYIATSCVKALIDKGFSVRGTVRKASKGEYLEKLFGDKFESIIVEDMAVPGAYDKAVVGVDGVFHIASVMAIVMGDPDEIIKPSVNGTLGLLESIKAYGHDVKRVVVTSSIAALGAGLDESAWNQFSIDEVTQKGAAASPMDKYCATKTLAERAAWDFIEKNKGAISFDLSTVIPPFVFGRMLQEGTDPSSINGSTYALLAGLSVKNPQTGEDLIKKEASLTDVQDVATAHIELLTREAAGNERYIVLAHTYTWQDVYDALNAAPAFKDVPVGQPGATKDKEWPAASSAKYLALLGEPADKVFRPFKETVRDAVEAARARGWRAD